MSASNRLGLPIRSAIEAELDMIDNIYNETATQASRLTEALARMRLDGGGGSYHAVSLPSAFDPSMTDLPCLSLRLGASIDVSALSATSAEVLAGAQGTLVQ